MIAYFVLCMENDQVKVTEPMLRHINDSHNHWEPDVTNIHPLTAKTQKHSEMRRLGDVLGVWLEVIWMC